MEQQKIFMILLGCKPAGRHTEQHDIFFTIGKDLKSIVPDMLAFWPEAKGNMHIDAWQEITQIDGYDVSVVEKNKKQNLDKKVFFINLGGYQKDEFEEFHYKILKVATNKAEAIKAAKQTAFFEQMNFGGAAVSHIDDQYGVDVDDIFDIEEILPKSIKDKFSIQLSVATVIKQDAINLGYLPIKKIV